MQGWNKVADGSETRTELNGDANVRHGQVSILDLVLILLERKWFILIGMFLICGTAVTTVLLLQSRYTSTVTVLPSKQKMSSPLGSLMGDMPLGGLLKSFDFLGQGDNNEFLSILDSRRLAEQVITRFDLTRHYGFHKKRKFYYENLLKEYHANVKVQEDDLSNITISVTDTNAQVAADIANYIVYQLDTISFQISNESARGSRIFFEARLDLIRRVLDSTHHALADFQVKHNFIDLETQVKATVEALASIEAEAMATDIQGELLSSSFGNNSRMAEIKRKKQVLDGRLKNYMEKGSGHLVLALEKTPQLSIQYAYLYRDVKINETLYAYILQMYEQAKFREANDSPVVTILEPAKPAQKRASPKRALICILAFFVGLTFLSSWVLVSHWYRHLRESRSDSYLKLQKLFSHFRPAR